MSATPFVGYWADGKQLVMDRSAVLPDRCVKCNEPAEGYRRTVKLSYVPVKTELLVGAIAYLSARTATVDVGLCGRHRASRSLNIMLISLAAIIASLYIFTSIRATDVALPLLATAGLIGGVVGLIYAAVGRRLLRAARITDTHIWLKGAGAAFLASIPSQPAIVPGGELPTLAQPESRPLEPATVAANAFREARTGALAFLIGCLITAGSYFLLSGTYLIVWGAVLFGLIRLIGGLRGYLAVGSDHRSASQMLMLAGIVAVGVVSLGGVITNEVQGRQFESSFTSAAESQTQAAKLFQDVVQRSGPWTSQDAADMRTVASLYTRAADTLAASAAPSDFAWYRDGLVVNFREAAAVASELAQQTSLSSQATFDALVARWNKRVNDYLQLQDRVEAQSK